MLKSDYANKNVLITGGMGLIGSNLAHRLVELGARVVIVDALLPLYGGNPFNLDGIKNKVNLIIGDIRDEALMNKVVEGQDCIFNLAAQVSYSDSQDYPYLDLDINCRGHLIILEACRKHNPDAKIIYSGSRLQFGKTRRNPVDEDHPLAPLSLYAIHKTTAEMYYRMYYQIYGIKSVIFRIANPYGVRCQMKHSKYGMVNWFIRLAMEDKAIRVFGDGRQVRDYIYVDDVVEGLLKAGVTSDADGEVFNLGSGEGTKFIDMARKVIEIVGAGRIESVPWPEKFVNIETGDYVTEISKATRVLDWRPQTPLDEGIKRTHLYYKENRQFYWQDAVAAPCR